MKPPCVEFSLQRRSPVAGARILRLRFIKERMRGHRLSTRKRCDPLAERVRVTQRSDCAARNWLVVTTNIVPSIQLPVFYVTTIPPGPEARTLPARESRPSENLSKNQNRSTFNPHQSLRAPSFRLFSGERVGNHDPQPIFRIGFWIGSEAKIGSEIGSEAAVNIFMRRDVGSVGQNVIYPSYYGI